MGTKASHKQKTHSKDAKIKQVETGTHRHTDTQTQTHRHRHTDTDTHTHTTDLLGGHALDLIKAAGLGEGTGGVRTITGSQLAV